MSTDTNNISLSELEQAKNNLVSHNDEIINERTEPIDECAVWPIWDESNYFFWLKCLILISKFQDLSKLIVFTWTRIVRWVKIRAILFSQQIYYTFYIHSFMNLSIYSWRFIKIKNIYHNFIQHSLYRLRNIYNPLKDCYFSQWNMPHTKLNT